MESTQFKFLKNFIEENKQTTSAYISPSLKNIREYFGWVLIIYTFINIIKNQLIL